MESDVSEVRGAELIKAWNNREPLADGDHPRSASFLLEYKNIGSSFIARPVDSIPELYFTKKAAADPIDLDEEESSSSEGDNRGATEGDTSEESSSGEGSSSSEGVSEDQGSSNSSSSSSEETAPPRRNLIRDDDDEDEIFFSQRSKKQKSSHGTVAAGSQIIAREQEKKRKEEEEKKRVEDRMRADREKKEKEEERRRVEVRIKAGQIRVPVSALPEGASVALSSQLAPALLERAVLPTDHQKATRSDQLDLQASQRLALVGLLPFLHSCNTSIDAPF